MSLATTEIKAFVPAIDFELSQQFCLALGFEIAWVEGGLAYLHHGDTSFLLQDFNQPAFFGARVDEPKDQPWGMRDFALFDPSNVLWRVAQDTD